jgi:hypothetical protein
MTEASVKGWESVDGRDDPTLVTALGAAGLFDETVQSAEAYRQQIAGMTYEDWFGRLGIYNSVVRTGTVNGIEVAAADRVVVGTVRLMSALGVQIDTRPSEDAAKEEWVATMTTSQNIVYVAPNSGDGKNLLRRAFEIANGSPDAHGGAKLLQTVIGLVQLFSDGNTRTAAIERLRRTHDYDGSPQAKAMFAAIEAGRRGIREAGLAVNAGKLLRQYADRLVQAAVQDNNYHGHVPSSLRPYNVADLKNKRSPGINQRLAILTATVLADRESGLQVVTGYLLSKDLLEGCLDLRDDIVEFNSAAFFDAASEEDCAGICHWHDRFKHTFIAQLIASFAGKPNELGDWEWVAKAVGTE